MQKLGFQETIERIVEEHPDYHQDAYHFLRETLEYTVKRLQKKRGDSSRHVNAEQLLDGWRQYSIRQFGPMVPTVMDAWSITSCHDIGVMVFRLIDAGLFGRNQEDSLEDFGKGYDFHEAFTVPYLPSKNKLNVSSQPVINS